LITTARQMIAVIITFRKSNKKSLEHLASTYQLIRKETSCTSLSRFVTHVIVFHVMFCKNFTYLLTKKQMLAQRMQVFRW